MNDLALNWQENGVDIALGQFDLRLDNSIKTSVLISLFTDRRALASDIIPGGNNDRRGYWGDSFRKRPIGSRLWLLAREKQTVQTLRRAENYAKEALDWLLADKLIKAYSVAASIPKGAILWLSITITLNDGSTLPMAFNATLNGV